MVINPMPSLDSVSVVPHSQFAIAKVPTGVSGSQSPI